MARKLLISHFSLIEEIIFRSRKKYPVTVSLKRHSFVVIECVQFVIELKRIAP